MQLLPLRRHTLEHLADPLLIRDIALPCLEFLAFELLFQIAGHLFGVLGRTVEYSYVTTGLSDGTSERKAYASIASRDYEVLEVMM